jgi:hypothetical protein
MRTTTIIGIVLTFCLLPITVDALWAQGVEPPEAEQEAIGQTPPRLSLIEGQVSFWRPGAEDWTQAQINTPIAPGDEFYTSTPGNLELQIGARAFVRASQNTFLSLENQEPDFLQFKLTSGVAAFDLRTVDPGRTVEVDTPHAVFIIERKGYYRVNANEDSTTFITYRSGEATVRPPNGDAIYIAPSRQVVVEGTAPPQITHEKAPRLDNWDKWNYARTDKVLEAIRSRYVPQDIYGLADLDEAGKWEVVPKYGTVWVPSNVPPGWAPYSKGSWVRDPFYGWTWVDAAPWGWAPYHYGRWVFVRGNWSWAPGPMVARPRYCPALVAFFGPHTGSVGIKISNSPVMAWVALGWGEPVVPWWGPSHFRHRPYWGGWRGPRIVNRVVVHNTTVVNVNTIHVYHNTTVRNAVVAVNGRHFGNGRIIRQRLSRKYVSKLRPAYNVSRIKIRPQNYVPHTHRGNRPPDRIHRRSVVSTRPARTSRNSVIRVKPPIASTRRSAPQQRVDPEPRRRTRVNAEQRRNFGRDKEERSLSDRPARSPSRRQGVVGPSPSRKSTEGVRQTRRKRPNTPDTSNRRERVNNRSNPQNRPDSPNRAKPAQPSSRRDPSNRPDPSDRRKRVNHRTNAVHRSAPPIRRDRSADPQQHHRRQAPPKTDRVVRQNQSPKRPAPPVDRRKGVRTDQNVNRYAPSKQRTINRGEPAGRSRRPSRGAESSVQPPARRQVQRVSPESRTAVRRQVDAHSRQADTMPNEPRRRMGKDH